MRKKWLLPLAALLALLCWFENRTIQVTTYVLPGSRLPQAFSGFRIALLTDLHGQVYGKNNARLVRRIAQEKPDLIAISGDLADEKTDLAMVEPLLRQLTALAPTCYVTGNHEWRMAERSRFFEILKQCGVQRLAGDYTVLERGGERIVLAGVDDPNGPRDQTTPAQLTERLRAEYPDAYVLMLCHRNDTLSVWAELGIDTVLAGHAHGGIVRLPVLGPVFGTHYDLFPKDAQGVYRQDGTALLVSRGLGPSYRLPLRVFNRPELPIVILQP